MHALREEEGEEEFAQRLLRSGGRLLFIIEMSEQRAVYGDSGIEGFLLLELEFFELIVRYFSH